MIGSCQVSYPLNSENGMKHRGLLKARTRSLRYAVPLML